MTRHTCTECDKPVTARGLCRMHYLRVWRSGTHTERPTRSAEEQPHCPADHPHDVDTCWSLHGCRCTTCIHERAMERQRRRNRLVAYGRADQIRAPHILAAPARAHVLELRDAGFGLERIAQAAAVGSGIMMALVYGPRGARKDRYPQQINLETRTIAASHAVRLLALTADQITAAIVPSTGAVRRLQALATLGYRQTDLAEMLGVNRTNFSTMIHGQRDRITIETHTAVDEIFGALWDKPQTGPHADRACQLAKRYRWVGPLAWDDIDDPAEQPAGVARVRDRRASADEILDDVAFLLELGESPDQAAALIGRTPGSLSKLAARHDRPELANQLYLAEKRAA